MEIEFKNIKINKTSIEKELLFTFQISNVMEDNIPINIAGELFTEDGLKIGKLNDTQLSARNNLNLNAVELYHALKKHDAFELTFSCVVSDKAINHIEAFRLESKETTKDVEFEIKLDAFMLKSNVTLASLHTTPGENLNGKEASKVLYQYNQNQGRPLYNDMWILSANSSPNILSYNRVKHNVRVKIDFMTWVNEFAKYLGIGDILVLELMQPHSTILSKKLAARYKKAQGALKEMRKQFSYGEWKQAIIASRPIFEMFKNFDDFKKLLLENEYTEAAYQDLKKSIDGYFGLISKFYHGLERNNNDVNPDIPIQKEDAYFAYSYSISLLHLISQKVKRKESK